MRVVLLHSALGDSRLWRRQIPALAPHFEVVSPDLPGYGATPLPRGDFSYVETVAEHLPAAVVGNSIGGRIALRAAGAYPDRISKLVLVAAGMGDWQWTEEMRAYYAAEEAAWDAQDWDAVVQISLDFWLPPELHDEVRPQLRRAVELQSAVQPEPELIWPESIPLSAVRVPTLVVVGDRDKDDFKAIAKRLAEEIPGAEYAVVEGAGHLVGVEQPEALNRLLLDFLTQDAGVAE